MQDDLKWSYELLLEVVVVLTTKPLKLRF